MSKPFVLIVLGSSSDLQQIEPARTVLRDLDIAHELRIASAHRTPDYLSEILDDAEARGCVLIIAVAGLSAHLPGVVAAHTRKPVLGVPVVTGPAQRCRRFAVHHSDARRRAGGEHGVGHTGQCGLDGGAHSGAGRRRVGRAAGSGLWRRRRTRFGVRTPK